MTQPDDTRMVSVPREPTEAMLKAPDDAGVGLYSREVFADIYRAMIAASPPLAEGGAGTNRTAPLYGKRRKP
jgi:hypothetical protein